MRIVTAIFLIVLFGALFLFALWDGNILAIIATGITLLIICVVQLFVFVPRLDPLK